MKVIASDPLLAIAEIILIFLMGVMVLAGVACLVAIPVVIFSPDVSVNLGKELAMRPTGMMMTAIAGVLVLAAALLGVLFRIFQLLYRLVATVAKGDPFVPDNARRLTQMAWLAVGVQCITLPLAAIGEAIDRWTGEAGEASDIHISGGFSGNGLLLVLILFILARVFRKGAEMRAELEGTV